MIRFLLTLLWTIIFLVGSLPVILVTWIIGFFSPDTKSKISWKVITFAFNVVIFLSGSKVEFKGLEKVPTDRPVLYCPNHRSLYDIIITYTKVPRPTGYVAKKETKRVPIFNIWMSFIHCQFLDRKDLRQGLKVILKCADLVKSGISICIFPEGTRNKGNDDFLPFHDGSFKIAEKSKCPIIPVAIVNSHAIFEDKCPRIRASHVIVEYCDPIEVDGMSREEIKGLSSRVHDAISEAYHRNLKEI